ncbi:MAG: hypothetical protein WAK75_02820 [Methanoregula sp.]|uniref:hypothetical protein n=1 Tax=Methanoregula sp. TaxID=2052170 RepID=UPI003BB14D02
MDANDWTTQAYEIHVTVMGQDKDAFVDIFQLMKKLIINESQQIKPESDFIEVCREVTASEDHDFEYLCGEIKNYKKTIVPQYDDKTGGEIVDKIEEPLRHGRIRFLLASKKDNRRDRIQKIYAIFSKKGYYNIERSFNYIVKKILDEYPLIANFRLGYPVPLIDTNIQEFFGSLDTISKIDVADVRLPNPRTISDYMKSLITLNYPNRILFEGQPLKKDGPIIVDLINMSYDEKYGKTLEIIGEKNHEKLRYSRSELATFPIPFSDIESSKNIFEKLLPLLKKLVAKQKLK